MEYRKTVVGVVYKGKDFLLVKKPHWNDWWDFPQGGLEEGESLEQALIRELEEELGVKEFADPFNTKLTHKRLFSEETLKHYPDKGFKGKELSYLLVEYSGDKNKISLGDDLEEFGWFNQATLLELLYKDNLEQARQVLKIMSSMKLI